MSDKILVIEDNADVRDNIAEILELAGYDVVQAENGKIGVNKALESEPALILCDIMMPELDGYGVLYLLSKNEKTRSIPFIYLTAKAEKSDIRKGMNEGADDYITKPFEEMELLQAVETRLNRSKQLLDASGSGKEQLAQITQVVSDITDLKDLAKDQRTKVYKKKEVIYSEGSYPHFVFLLEKGKVKTFKSNEDGKDLILEVINKDSFFGYIPVISDSPYMESAMAMEESSCIMIPKDEFLKLLHAKPEITSVVVKMLSSNIRDKEQELINLAYNSVRKRVALGILRLAEKYDGGLDGVAFPASREDVANIVGTATESVIRVIGEFKEDSLIEIEGRKLRVTDPVRLKNLPY